MKRLTALFLALALAAYPLPASAQEADRDPAIRTIETEHDISLADEQATELVDGVYLTPTQKIMLDLMNEAREEAGLAAFQTNAVLQQAAQDRARELAEEYSHTRPDGREWYTILYDAGVSKYTWMGENIARGHHSGEAVSKDWLDSEGHRKSIFKEKHKYMGMACYQSGPDIFWIQLFMS